MIFLSPLCQVQPGTVPGPACYLSTEEESEVVHWIGGCAEIGCAKIIMSKIISKKYGYIVNVSQGWWDKFQKRHPELALQSSEMLAYKYAIAVNKAVIDH